MQVGLLAPHALEPRLEVLAQESRPVLALDAAPAPVELEQNVSIEVAVDLVQGYLELPGAPKRWGGDRRIGAGGAAHGGIRGRRRVVGLGGRLVAQDLSGAPRANPQ